MWKLVGYDAFSSEWYNISNHRTKEAAVNAGKKRLTELEKSQPAITSGGQHFYGIQDRVFIEDSKGKRNRVV